MNIKLKEKPICSNCGNYYSSKDTLDLWLDGRTFEKVKDVIIKDHRFSNLCNNCKRMILIGVMESKGWHGLYRIMES